MAILLFLLQHAPKKTLPDGAVGAGLPALAIFRAVQGLRVDRRQAGSYRGWLCGVL